MKRRQFMQSSAMAGVALTLGAPITPIVGHKKPWFEISLAQWSFHRSLNRQQTPHLDNLDFARTAKTLGINGVEYVNTFFKTEARDEAYVTRMKQRADDAGVRSLLIMVDNEGALGHPNEKERRQAVQNHELWLRSARQLGCHSIRVNASSQGSREDQASRAADGLSKLCERADTYKINVLVENHGGYSSDGKWLSSVIRSVGHPRIGTLPDFGNFRVDDATNYDRYLGVTELMPYAKAVSAKSHEFDDNGNEKNTDYKKMLGIVRSAGYRGWVGIEYEGTKHSEIDGIRKTKALLERVRQDLDK